MKLRSSSNNVHSCVLVILTLIITSWENLKSSYYQCQDICWIMPWRIIYRKPWYVVPWQRYTRALQIFLNTFSKTFILLPFLVCQLPIAVLSCSCLHSALEILNKDNWYENNGILNTSGFYMYMTSEWQITFPQIYNLNKRKIVKWHLNLKLYRYSKIIIYLKNIFISQPNESNITLSSAPILVF